MGDFSLDINEQTQAFLDTLERLKLYDGMSLWDQIFSQMPNFGRADKVIVTERQLAELDRHFRPKDGK